MPEGSKFSAKTLLQLCFGCQLATLGMLRRTTTYSLWASEIATYPALSLWVARMLSVIVLVGVCVAIAHGQSLLSHRRLLVANGTVLVAGSAITLLAAANLPLYLLGQVCIGISHAWVLACWAEYLATLATAERNRCIAYSAVVSAVIFSIVALVGSRIQSALFIFAAICSVVGLYLLGVQEDAAAHAAAREPSSLREAIGTMPGELVVVMACYAMLFRITTMFDFPTVDDDILSAVTLVLRIGVIVLLAAYIAHKQFVLNLRQLIMPLLFITIIGMVLLPMPGTLLPALSLAIAHVSWTFFYTVMWLILLEMGEQNGRTPLTFFVGWTILNAILLLAAPITTALNDQVNAGALSLTALALVVIYMLSVALLLMRTKGLAGRDVQTQEQEQAQGSEGEGASWTEGQEEFFREVAGEFKLTRRETEVFELLVQGYSLPSIEEKFVLSHSTVKGHARNIYRKFEVEGKQQLIEKVHSLREERV